MVEQESTDRLAIIKNVDRKKKNVDRLVNFTNVS